MPLSTPTVRMLRSITKEYMKDTSKHPDAWAPNRPKHPNRLAVESDADASKSEGSAGHRLTDLEAALADMLRLLGDTVSDARGLLEEARATRHAIEARRNAASVFKEGE